MLHNLVNKHISVFSHKGELIFFCQTIVVSKR